MLQRNTANSLAARLAAYPAAALVGPRQCGKTTLARSLGGVYFDLEQPGDRLHLDLNWPELIAGDDRRASTNLDGPLAVLIAAAA